MDRNPLLQIPNLRVGNFLVLDHSFWYGYLDANPKLTLEKYAKLQMKAFPSISNRCFKFKHNDSSKWREGIVSAGLVPVDQLLKMKRL